MSAATRSRPLLMMLSAGAAVAVGAYAAMVGTAWYRYGRAAAADADPRDELLDRFMPTYEVFERHRIHVEAPAAVTLATARDQDLFASPLIRLMMAARAAALGGTPEDRSWPPGLLAQMQALGWGILAEEPGREVVVGAVTRPWEANVVFRTVAPDRFAAFNEPDYVKIAWTLRADPAGEVQSIFRTETRAAATDAAARARFHRYWPFVWPGVASIRWLLLTPVKQEAERRARQSSS